MFHVPRTLPSFNVRMRFSHVLNHDSFGVPYFQTLSFAVILWVKRVLGFQNVPDLWDKDLPMMFFFFPRRVCEK